MQQAMAVALPFGREKEERQSERVRDWNEEVMRCLAFYAAYNIHTTCASFSRLATTTLSPIQKPEGAANTTSKIRLKPKLPPSVTPKSVSDSFNQLHCVIELHEYSNIS